MATRRVCEAVLLVLSVLACAVSGAPFDDGSVQEVLRQEFQDAIKTGHVGPTIRRVARELDLASMMKSSLNGHRVDGLISGDFCTTCATGMDEVLYSLRNGTDSADIANMLVNMCKDVLNENQLLCDHFIAINQPQLFWVLQNREGLTGTDACGMVFLLAGCETDNPDRVWEVTLPAVPKPPVKPPTLPEPGAPVMKVLHLADTHYDMYYLPGSSAVCEIEYQCCRAESGEPATPEEAAGFWGDLRECDIPRWTLEAVYANINQQHPDLDFIIWTGDLVPHNVWNTSREGNLNTIRAAVQMVKDYFPGVPVFPAIGNHESHPVNSFPQPYIDNEFDISWLYDEIVTLWQTWLPPDAAASITYSGYYSTLIKPGLRILSINSNYCYGLNMWLIYDDVDPASELEWMAKELQAAEDTGEKVYLISHHPPGHEECSRTWSHQYNRIILRYESTIAGLFYGHTHKDHFMMVYDPDEPNRAALVGYVGQSQGTYHRVNPGYKVYTVDGDYKGSSYQVLDHENYILNLDEANKNTTADPRVYLLYTAKEEYNLTDLTPASWSGLVDRMNETDSEVFDIFFMNYIKNSSSYMNEGCKRKCKSDLLCQLVVSDTSDYSHCEYF